MVTSVQCYLMHYTKPSYGRTQHPNFRLPVGTTLDKGVAVEQHQWKDVDLPLILRSLDFLEELSPDASENGLVPA